jgi:NAD(P)-dependent dehydrogenase (short-subunit alcohol dehydrogenase family)
MAAGFFHTQIMAASDYTEDETKAHYARLQPRVPLRRVGRPADLQGTAVYLASGLAGTDAPT